MVAGVALLAGADAGLAVRLGVSMTLLQLGIGTVNDVVDAPFDAGRKPHKPIPSGSVDPAAARAVAVACFVAGIGLAATVSVPVAVLAVVVVAIGLSYDLRLKGTAWSWLPFAVGIPILPVYGWLGATGGLPASFALLVPAAVVAGAALAVGNSLVDVERDVAAGRTSVAARVGPRRAAIIAVALFVLVALAAGVSVVAFGGGVVAALATAGAGLVPVVAAAAAAGPRSPRRREIAWRVEAIGTGLLAIAWIGLALR